MPGLSPDVIARHADPKYLSRETPAAVSHDAPRPFWPMAAMLGVMGAGQAADAVTTIRRGDAREANAVYGEDPSAGRVIATKAGIMGPLGFLLARAYPHHPKLAAGAAAALGGVGFALAAHNAKVPK